MQFYPDVAAVQVWTVLKMKEAKRLVWNMCLLLSIRGSVRMEQSHTMKRPVSIHRITAGIARVSGEK